MAYDFSWNHVYACDNNMFRKVRKSNNLYWEFLLFFHSPTYYSKWITIVVHNFWGEKCIYQVRTYSANFCITDESLMPRCWILNRLEFSSENTFFFALWHVENSKYFPNRIRQRGKRHKNGVSFIFASPYCLLSIFVFLNIDLFWKMIFWCTVLLW